MRKILTSGRYSERGDWRRSSAIETVVTDKHIRAWAAFLETGADFLICFEDDAVFRSDSTQRLTDPLNILHPKYQKAIYVDLVGGCTNDALQTDMLQTSHDAAFRHYRKPVKNTACVYLISRPLVATFYDTPIRRP